MKTPTNLRVHNVLDNVVGDQNSYLQKTLLEDSNGNLFLLNDFVWPLARGQTDSDYIILDLKWAYRPDLLAAYYYGTVHLWWVPLKHNRLVSIFELAPGTVLEIPTLRKVRDALKKIRTNAY